MSSAPRDITYENIHRNLIRHVWFCSLQSFLLVESKHFPLIILLTNYFLNNQYNKLSLVLSDLFTELLKGIPYVLFKIIHLFWSMVLPDKHSFQFFGKLWHLFYFSKRIFKWRCTSSGFKHKIWNIALYSCGIYFKCLHGSSFCFILLALHIYYYLLRHSSTIIFKH